MDIERDGISVHEDRLDDTEEHVREWREDGRHAARDGCRRGQFGKMSVISVETQV